MSRGTPCVFSPHKIVDCDSLQNYTEDSPGSVEDIHRILAFLDKFLISLFHKCFVRKMRSTGTLLRLSNKYEAFEEKTNQAIFKTSKTSCLRFASKITKKIALGL